MWTCEEHVNHLDDRVKGTSVPTAKVPADVGVVHVNIVHQPSGLHGLYYIRMFIDGVPGGRADSNQCGKSRCLAGSHQVVVRRRPGWLWGASFGRRVVERCYDGEAVGRLDSHGCGMDHPPDYWSSVDVHVLEYTQFTWS